MAFEVQQFAQIMAQNEFRRLRLQGALQHFVDSLLRRTARPCAFECAQKSASIPGQRTLQDICLGRVVGSVGRSRDYTRGFLPLRRNDEARWVSVRLAAENEDLPPIEVYQLGEA